MCRFTVIFPRSLFLWRVTKQSRKGTFSILLDLLGKLCVRVLSVKVFMMSLCTPVKVSSTWRSQRDINSSPTSSSGLLLVSLA